VLRLDGKIASNDAEWLRSCAEVAQVRDIKEPYILASRSFQKRCSVLQVGEVYIGGESDFVIMAGPCSVESEKQIRAIARAVKQGGADVLRGGAFKPRTSPYEFQGLGVEGLKLLRGAADENNMPCVTEILDVDQLEDCARYADILQVGARNAQNFALLRELGRVGKPVLLKRGMAAQVHEWLLASEYILASGNRNVILCERGIRTFENSTRSTLDISAVPVAQARSHLPVIVDPSHAAGARALVPSLACAAAAAGAHGLIVEVHNDPEHAWSDGPQALLPEVFASLAVKVREISRLTADVRRATTCASS
jgi:3-deoxy-7-phosphoheptulonate synthase